jgi:hypothetical protein
MPVTSPIRLSTVAITVRPFNRETSRHWLSDAYIVRSTVFHMILGFLVQYTAIPGPINLIDYL